MASFPGTVKNFGPPPQDQVDTIVSDHIQALRAEVVAIQTVLGVNPQGVAATVAARFGAVDGNFVTTTGNQIVEGNKTYYGMGTYDGDLRAAKTTALTAISSTTHPFQVGASTGDNLAFAGRVVQARSNNAVANLTLQPLGGDAYVGAGKIWTSTNDGPSSGCDADTVDGKHAADFATTGHQHAANFAQVYRNSTQSIPNDTWTTAIFNATSVHYKESGSDMMTLSNGHFHTPPAVGPALYQLSFRASFPSGNKTGTRRIRFLTNTGTVIDEALEEASLTAKDFVSLSTMYYFPGTSGAYVSVQVYQNSGSSLSLQAHTTSNPFVATWAAMVRGLG